MKDQAEVPVSSTGCLVRLCWMFFGNALLFFLLVSILMRRPEFPSLLDAACLFTVCLVIGVRYLDIRFLDGRTAEDKPATMTHWRRYAFSVGVAGFGTWLLARVVTHFLK